MSRRVISAVLTLQDRSFSAGLRRANREAGDFGRYVQAAQNKVEDFSNRVTTGFKAVGVAAGALAVGSIAGLGAAVAAQVVEADDAFAKLSAQTGAIGVELGEYKAIAKDVFTNGLSESISEASTTMGKFANMFRDLEYTELADVTSGSFTIAKAFDQEVNEVGRAVKALMTHFDELSGTDATDLITVAFRKTGDYADDLLGTFSEYSGYFDDIGFTGEKFVNMLIKGTDAGAFNIDKVGDAIKEFSFLSTDGSQSTSDGFKAIGLNADDMASRIIEGGDSANQAYMATIAGLAGMDDKVARNNAGIALFGTMWEELRDNVVLSMSDSSDALGDYKGVTEDALDTLTSGPISRIRNAWRDLVIQLSGGAEGGAGKSFLDGVANGAEQAVPVILDLANKAMGFAQIVHQNWTPIKETVIGITTAVVAFKVGMATMTVVTAATKFLLAYRNAATLGTGAMFLFNNVIRANPIGFAVTAIAGLVAIGVVLYRNWDTVTAKTKEVWASIGGLEGALRIVTGPIGVVIGAAIDLATNWDSTKSVWENVWGAMKRSAADTVNTVVGGINSMIETINKIPGVNIPVIAKVEWGSVDQSKVSMGDFRKIEAEGNFAVGSNRITHDQVANIHKDEMIIPALQAARVRAAGGNINNIDKLVSQKPLITSSTSSGTGTSAGQGETIIQQLIINAKGITVAEVMNEVVPQLKLAFANR